MKDVQATPREKNDPRLARAKAIQRELAKLYPDAHCALHFSNPYQLLVATILSAQCTDVLVNKITPAFFAKFPDATTLAMGTQEEVETLIQKAGFFRMKAKNLRACAKQIVEKFAGDVPNRLEDLVPLAGVGRKTANVVLGNAFDTPGLTVDTHVGRLSRRMAFTEHEDPLKVEADLMSLVPNKEWTIFSHRMIFHGRRVCQARKPKCEECTLARHCPKIGVET